jgi:raffinose/stachyose/melibiose transport system permease protein
MVAMRTALVGGRGKAGFFTLAVLLGPALILFTALVIVPVFEAAVFSLYKWNGLGPLVNFKGLQNFAILLGDTIIHRALLHNFEIALASLVIQLPIAMGLALIVCDPRFKSAVFFRTFFFLPYVLSEVITGVLWQFIYQPQFGLIKSLYAAFAPNLQSPALLGNPSTVLGAIMAVILWKYFGLHMTIYIAGLQDIPKEQIEAATIDGASSLQTFRKIIFPGMRTSVQLSVFFCIIGSFQIFDVVWAMGKGDPVNAGETIVTYLYKVGLLRFNIGYGGAIAVFIFFLCLAFSVAYQKLLVREEE